MNTTNRSHIKLQYNALINVWTGLWSIWLSLAGTYGPPSTIGVIYTSYI